MTNIAIDADENVLAASGISLKAMAISKEEIFDLENFKKNTNFE